MVKIHIYRYTFLQEICIMHKMFTFVCLLVLCHKLLMLFKLWIAMCSLLLPYFGQFTFLLIILTWQNVQLIEQQNYNDALIFKIFQCLQTTHCFCPPAETEGKINSVKWFAKHYKQIIYLAINKLFINNIEQLSR